MSYVRRKKVRQCAAASGADSGGDEGSACCFAAGARRGFRFFDDTQPSVPKRSDRFKEDAIDRHEITPVI